MLGQTLGHYRIIEQIGAGGMGEVYRAHDEQLDRDVALKVLPVGTLTDEGARRQFRSEALALAKLNHPNIETVYEFNTQDGVDFLAMELIPGCVLSEQLKTGPLPEKEIVQIGTQLADGLTAAHERRVIHRDLKPGNLMITPDSRVKILDFGLARFIRPSQEADQTVSVTTNTGTISGTVPYMSPEQLRGLPVDERSDIYAAGALLYEMATGHRPFPQSQSAELVGAILHQAPDAPSSHNRAIRPILESVIMKALEKDPARRHQSARELKIALEGVGSGQMAAAPAPRRAVLIAGVAITCAILLLIGLGFGLNTGGFRNRVLGRGASRAAEVNAATVSSPRVKPRRSVAVLGFKNISQRPEEAWLSTALSEMLTTELAAGEQLRAVPGENVSRMKMNLALPETDSYGKETLEKIRKNLDADEVVLGSYVPLGGGQIRVDLRLQDTRAGETLEVASVKGEEAQVDDLVSRAGATLREKLGVGGVSDAQALSLKATLPQNSAAARLYSEGLQRLRQFDYLHARQLLQSAVETEPQYALAHSALAAAWKGLGYDNQAKEEAKKAFDLAGNFSREDRLWIEGQYHEMTNERAKAVETYQTLFEFFPDNLDYGLRLATAQSSAAKGKDALATLAALRKLPPPAPGDPRLDLASAVASASLGDYKGQEGFAGEAVTKADSQGNRLLAAQARISQCSALRYVGKLAEAIAVCEQAAKIFEEAGDQGNAARAINNIAVVHMEQGDMVAARKNYEESLATVRKIGDKKLEGMALNNLAGVLEAQGDVAGSRRMLEQGMSVFRETGDKRGVSGALDNIGILLVQQGELKPARKRYEEALGISKEMGNKSLTAYALYLLGDVDFYGGQFAAARRDYEQALAIRKEMGDPRTTAETQLALASLAIEEKHFAEAESAARDCGEQFEKLKTVDNEALAYSVLSQALSAQGKDAEAQAASEKAAQLSQKGGDTNARLRVTIASAVIRAKSGRAEDVSSANEALRAALGEANKQGLTGLQLEARLALAQIASASGDRGAGRVQLGAVERDAASKGMLLIAHRAARSK
jgi:eukaryotic-like serine/threonine-protein kinase